MKKLSRSIENRLLKVRNQLIVRKDLMKHHSKNIILPKKQDLDWLKNNEKKIIYFLKLYKLSSKLETFPDYKKKYIKNKIKYLKIKNKRFKILNCDENKLLSKIVKRKKYYNTYNIKIKKKSR